MDRSTRLGDAIAAWRSGSVREFQREIEPMLKERGERGGSYTMIHRYLKKGDPQPPTGFLLVAAELLGVRTEWLLAGKGQMTEAEEQVATLPRSELGFKMPGPVAALATRGGMHVITLWMAVARQLIVASKRTRGDVTPEEMEAIGAAISEFVIAPLDRLYPEPVTDLQGHEEYLVAALHALNLAIPSRGQGRPLDDMVADFREGGQ